MQHTTTTPRVPHAPSHLHSDWHAPPELSDVILLLLEHDTLTGLDVLLGVLHARQNIPALKTFTLGQLHPALKDLQQRGLIRRVDGRPRVRYTLTNDGRHVLTAL